MKNARASQLMLQKSCFLVSPTSHEDLAQRVKRFTNYRQTEFHVNYLGCHLYVGRKKIFVV